MWILKTKSFGQFCRKQSIGSDRLIKAVGEIESGLIHAPLGNGLFKQRVSRTGEGKSGGFRTILVYRTGDLALFVHGFAKNDKGNLDREELARFRQVGAAILALSADEIELRVSAGLWIEVT